MLPGRVISSVGRAPRLHRGCREFESLITHQLSNSDMAIWASGARFRRIADASGGAGETFLRVCHEFRWLKAERLPHAMAGPQLGD